MPIIATASKSYTLHPAGLAQAVCVDVVDLGMVEVPAYSDKEKAQGPRKAHKVLLVWQSEEADERGEPIQLKRRYTLSLDKKASLRRDLESWRGKPFNDLELGGFDLEVLLGVNCFINVIHDERDGKTYANVASISPLRKGTPLLKPIKYVRVQDRPKDEQNGSAPPSADFGDVSQLVPPPDDEDTVPF